MLNEEKYGTYDVIIIGGSAAGLSAAMTLGRSQRKVLIIDEGLPCNRQTPHSHNFLTQDGATPAQIALTAKSQVLAYPTVYWESGRAQNVTQEHGIFVVRTDRNGEYFKGKKLILATGIKDILPTIPGFDACWGITAIHCPYCHGYEFRGKKTAILANGERAMHLVSLVRNLTADLTLLTNGTANLDAKQLKKLRQHDITLIEAPLISLIHEKGHVRQLVLEGTDHLTMDALYAAVPFQQHSNIHRTLGCTETEQGHIKIDAFQKTNVPGVFACGDNSSGMRSVANAVAAGNLAGAAANMELVQDNF
ncbi:NAD(P)/FAD-dependent oxidoreductase [Sphingobacterium suaedae]|uniref:NAD(P)/FAD-dependent oxidoreductase n=1 Tax=Sphingobacterium suaedae TaxID=1686402 RepID=A0ABW5KD43_9SPHI